MRERPPLGAGLWWSVHSVPWPHPPPPNSLSRRFLSESGGDVNMLPPSYEYLAKNEESHLHYPCCRTHLCSHRTNLRRLPSGAIFWQREPNIPHPTRHCPLREQLINCRNEWRCVGCVVLCLLPESCARGRFRRAIPRDQMRGIIGPLRTRFFHALAFHIVAANAVYLPLPKKGTDVRAIATGNRCTRIVRVRKKKLNQVGSRTIKYIARFTSTTQ